MSIIYYKKEKVGNHDYKISHADVIDNLDYEGTIYESEKDMRQLIEDFMYESQKIASEDLGDFFEHLSHALSHINNSKPVYVDFDVENPSHYRQKIHECDDIVDCYDTILDLRSDLTTTYAAVAADSLDDLVDDKIAKRVAEALICQIETKSSRTSEENDVLAEVKEQLAELQD